MTAALGRRQIEMLCMMGSPSMVKLGTGRVAESLQRRGLLTDDRCPRITPAGLRALAAALEGGRCDHLLWPVRGGQPPRLECAP